MSMRTKFFISSSVLGLQSQLRASLFVSQYTFNPLGPSNLRTSWFSDQYTFYQEQLPKLRTAFTIAQYAQVAPETFMATEIFPELIGVSWDVHLKPQFSTKIATHTSGKESRTAFWEQPVYDI